MPAPMVTAAADGSTGPVRPSPPGVERAYRFAALDHYNLRQRIAIRLIGIAAYCCIATFGRTIRWQVEGWENFERARAIGRGIVFTCWHNRVFLATWFWRRRRIVVMTSQSFDGEYIARLIQRFGYGAARGSSSRGAGRALLLMVRCLREGLDTAFTIDGPRGPRYIAKRGATLVAHRTGALILPFHVSSDHYWTVHSWDGFQVPKPFSRAVVLIGQPIAVRPAADETEIESVQARLQSSLDHLRAEGDRRWSNLR